MYHSAVWKPFEPDTLEALLRRSPYWTEKSYSNEEVRLAVADASGVYLMTLEGVPTAVGFFEDQLAFDGPKKLKRRLTLLFNLTKETFESRSPVSILLGMIPSLFSPCAELQVVVPVAATWLLDSLPFFWKVLFVGPSHSVYVSVQ